MKTAKLTASVSCLRTLLCLLALTLFASSGFAQVTVTNPGNTTPGLSATYASLAAAITDLNAQTAISGPVVITLDPGNPQTAPAGGYSITTPLLTGASATNNITLDGSGNTITAPAPQTAGGALNDAIFKIIGADFITIQNFTMLENAVNLVTAAGTNDMTEWGVALLYASTTNGAQNCTIQNNTITLNRTYQNTFGIYSNSTHSATAPTTSATATTTAGGNSGLKVYGNNISNVNNGIVVVGPTAAADMNTGVDIGGAALATGNTLTNYGNTGTFSSYANVSGTVYGILVRNSIGYNISFNSITSASGAGGVIGATLRGIYVPAASVQPTGTFTNNVNNNTLAVTSHLVTGVVQGITVESTTSTPTSTTNIDNNNFTTLNHSIAAASGAITAISQSGSATAGPLVTSVSSNTFTNITSSSTGSFTFISNSWTAPAAATKNVNNNSIVTAFTKTGAGGTVTLFTDNGSDPATVVTNNTGNNFSNITLTGATTMAGWSQTNGGTPSKTVTGNTFSNWTGGTASMTVLSSNFGGSGVNVSNNTISTISYAPIAAGTTLTGINIGASNSGATQTYSNNSISGLSSAGVGGQVIGILGGSTSITTLNINNNTVSGISSASTAGPVVAGIFNQSTGPTVNIFKNKVFDVVCSPGAVIGINSTAAAATNTINVYNNIVGRLYATTSGFFQSARGMLLQSTVAANYNVFYNTIYLDGTSPTQTYCVYIGGATANVPNVNAINNVFVNNVTSSNGAALPQCVYFRLGTTNATNLAATTSNNLLYCRTPAADHLIYVDGAVSALTNPKQTLASYQAFVSPRESADWTELPTFLNTTTGSSADYLHMNAASPTPAESTGVPITLPFSITDDFDGNTRNATTPDLGADEFNGIFGDSTPPDITYTPLVNTATGGSRNLTATIIDPIGVPTAGAGLPVLYWKINAGSYTGATATWLGGNQYQFSFGSGTVSGDTVSYYVVAQDNFTTPNVIANPSAGAGGYTATPPASGTPPTTPNSYHVGTITGTKTVGVGGDYATLTAAIADLNNNVLDRPLVLSLTDATYPSETFPLVINANPGSSATNTVTIKPAVGVTPLISGSAAGALIKFNGASFMTIDGSNSVGDSTRDLTITNTSTTTPTVVWFGSVGTTPITNDVLKNCVVINGANTNSAVVISDGATLGNAGFFSNMTVQNNSVQRAFVGVYATGGTIPQNGSNLLYTQNDLSTSGANAIRSVGLYMQGVNGATVSQNTVGNLESTISENKVGIWLATGTINAAVSNNTVTNLGLTTTTGAPIGISVTSGTGTTGVSLTGNTVSGLSTSGSGGVSGISVSGTTNGVTIDRNNVNGITNNNTVTSGAFGMFLTGGSNHVIKNNFVSNITHNMSAAAFSTTTGVFGISIQSGTGHQVYDNSVNLFGLMPGTAAASQLTAAFALVSTASTGCDVRNNIFANNITGGTTSIAHVSVYLPSGGTSAMNLTWNNNAYYNGTDVARNGLGQAGTTAGTNFFTTLTALKAYTATLLAGGTNDNVSVAGTGNVTFVSTTDLHVDPSIATLIESAGTPIAGITTDIDGDTRNASTPDIGADELNGIVLDLTPPIISYTPLLNTNSTSDRILVATITDASGIPTSGIGRPVLYWRINAGAYTGATATSLGSNQYQFTFGSGVVTPDVVSYYVVAQDSASPPNFASSPSAGASGFTANPPAVSTPPTTPNSYTIVPGISGNKTVGSGGDYATLTAAVTALNAANLRGPVVLLLTDATYPSETFPIAINANGGASAVNTITIKPAPGVSPTITGSSTSCMINLNGADFVTIDGSNTVGGTSRDLTIINTNTGTATADVCLTSLGAGLGATNNVVKNVNLVGTSVTATQGTLAGVFSGSATISNASAGADNDNNTIQNNNITKTVFGVYSGGASAANKNTGTVITQNLMNAASPNNITNGGVLVKFEDGVQITNNTISGIAFSGTFSNPCFGIALGVTPSNTLTTFTGSDVTNALVSKNSIGTVAHTGTGSSYGIVVNSVTSGTTLVVNNMISGVGGGSNPTPSDFVAGILAGGGTGSTTQIYFNSVSMSGNLNGTSTSPSYGLAIGSGNPIVDVKDNILYNIQTNTGGTGKHYAIANASTTGFTNMTSNYNDLFVTGAAGHVGQTGALGASGTDQSNLAAWTAATGQDTPNSLSVNPLFTSTTDLHLPTGSPVLGMGVTISGVNDDIDGDLRPTPPDIGADENPDNDGDGDPDVSDCNDFNPTVFTGAPELCDGLDNDCDTLVDEGFPNFDGDALADCVDPDDDNDGDPDVTDCDDFNPAIFTGATELCDGLDNDCDTAIDEGFPNFDGDAMADCVDPDDDNDGDPDVTDCDDFNPAISTLATEVCDGIDNDCDTLVDEGFPNFDGDAMADCVDPDDDNDGDPDVTDCDDFNATVFTGAPELCDGIDNDCDTVIDEGCAQIEVTIQLESVTAASITRCIRFELFDSTSVNPTPPPVDMDVTFIGGIGTATLPFDCGDYDCVLIRDTKHTLAQRLPIVTTRSGGGCAATATGANALPGGNLNDDEYVDILDFSLFVTRYGTSPGASSPCGTPGVHADISGNGIVDAADYTYIAANFLDGSDDACGLPLAGGGAPITSITIPELFAMGMGELVVADLNHDGILNLADIAAYLASGQNPGVFAIYEGPAGGRWSNPANWSGHVVPSGLADTVITREVVLDVPGAVAKDLIIIPGGLLRLVNAGGLSCNSVYEYSGGLLSLEGATSLLATPTVTLEGAHPLNWGAGTIAIGDGGDLMLTSGTLTIGDQILVSPFTPPSAPAILELGAGAEASAAGGVQVLIDGSIVGHGNVVDDVLCSGSLLPQTALTFGGDLTLAFDSIVHVQLRADGADALQVAGALTLGGSLDVTLDSGFVPKPGASFEVLTASAVTPSFGYVGLPQLRRGTLHVQYLPDRVLIVRDP